MQVSASRQSGGLQGEVGGFKAKSGVLKVPDQRVVASRPSTHHRHWPIWGGESMDKALSLCHSGSFILRGSALQRGSEVQALKARV
jgi:hypothetical protein